MNLSNLALGLCCILLLAGASRVSASDDAQREMAKRLEACTPCHGAAGKGTDDPYFPRLAGKPAGYLYNQLLAFRSGRRKYPPMNYLLHFLPDTYLRQIAEHYASQSPPLPAPDPSDVSAAILAEGEKLALAGDAERGLPACVSCHGAFLTGQKPGIPGLLGLRASYISAQLGGWRYGTRTANAPDCMQVVAGNLSEDDVRALSAWLASRPAPANRDPEPEGTFELPLTCGSQVMEGHQ